MRNRFNYSGFPDIARPQWAGREINPEDMLPGGAKVDDTVLTDYTAAVTVTLGAAAAVGDQALTVTALTAAVPAGIVLNFGLPTAQAVVLQAAAANATSIAVAPLEAAIPNASTAYFRGQYGRMLPAGTLVSRTYAQRAAGTGFHPAVDPSSTITLTAAPAQGAVALTVAALTKAVPAGAQINFGGEVVTTTAAAAIGATALAVKAIANAIPNGTVATYLATEDEYFLTAFDVRDAQLDNDVSLVIPGDFPIKENFLPNYAYLVATPALLALVRSKYVCTLGA